MNSFLNVIRSSFSLNTWEIIGPAIGQTLYMSFITVFYSLALGIILGILLVVTDQNGIYPMPTFNRVFGAVINVLRSFPSMILIILTLPLSRFIVGKSYGPDACILALVMVVVPMLSRLVESSLRDVTRGKVEAAQAMGSSNMRIVVCVLLPEALPSLIRNTTIAFIAIISTTALAGSFGAGGLGAVAVQYGYDRFETEVLIAAVLVLVVIVQAVQLTGDLLAKHLQHKWSLS